MLHDIELECGCHTQHNNTNRRLCHFAIELSEVAYTFMRFPIVSPSPSFEWEHMVDPSAVAPRAAATVVQALTGCGTNAKITIIMRIVARTRTDAVDIIVSLLDPVNGNTIKHQL